MGIDYSATANVFYGAYKELDSINTIYKVFKDYITPNEDDPYYFEYTEKGKKLYCDYTKTDSDDYDYIDDFFDSFIINVFLEDILPDIDINNIDINIVSAMDYDCGSVEYLCIGKKLSDIDNKTIGTADFKKINFDLKALPVNKDILAIYNLFFDDKPTIGLYCSCSLNMY